MLGLMASAGAVLEFILNPLLGRMRWAQFLSLRSYLTLVCSSRSLSFSRSDTYGRFLFIMLGPIGQLLCDGTIAMFPNSLTAVIAGRVVTGMTMVQNTTTLQYQLPGRI